MIELIVKDHRIESTLPEGFTFLDEVLNIPANKVYDDPVKVVIQDDNHEALKIIVGKHTQVKIILEVASEEAVKHGYHMELVAQENSHVKYLLVSELASEEALFEHYFTVGRDAYLDLVGGFVSNIIDAKMHVDLIGQGAEVKMRAIAVSSDRNKQNIDVLIMHKAPYTIGHMTNIGIANKRGKIILNGVEKIEKGMKQANAFQTLKGIITSDESIVEVNPILLIDEYDVQAGHGATIGKIEEDQLYYLQSRGLTKAESEKLIINGFLKPVVDEIEDEPLKERFVNLVNSRI